MHGAGATADATRLRGSRPSTALRRRAAVVAAAVGVLLLELVIAGALTQPQMARLLGLLVATLALAAVFAWPLGATVGLLLLGASALPHFTYMIHPLDVRLHELLLGALLLTAIVSPRSRSWGGVAGAALAVFLGLVALSGALAIADGRVDPSDAQSFGRPLALYAVFWVVVRLFPDAPSLRRLLIGALLCGAVAGLIAIPIALGSSLREFVIQGQNVVRQLGGDGVGGLLRVRLPGIAFSYILFWWSLLAVLTSTGRRRVGLGVLAAASTINILLSFNRNMWVGLLLGLGLMLVLAGGRVRHVLLSGLAVGVMAGVLMVTVVADRTPAGQLEPVVERAATLLDPQQLAQERSLRARAAETTTAWRTFLRNPVLGVGPGTDFGVRFGVTTRTGVPTNTTQRFLHNQWLWLLLIGGIPALVAFVAFMAAVLARAWAPATRTLSQTALGIGLAITAVSSFVMISLSVTEFCLAIGLVAGVIVNAHQLERQRRLQPG
jgi:O-antigen ligase